MRIYFHFVAMLCCMCFLQAYQSSVESRVGYFYSTSSRFRDIYSGAGLYSAEAATQVNKQLSLWGSLGFLYTSGKSIGQRDSTSLFAMPVCLGIKYPFRFRAVHPYLGIGLATVPISKICNDSLYVTNQQYGWGIGGIIKSGLKWMRGERVFLDTFLDYTFVSMNYSHKPPGFVIKNNANLSGLSFGLGLGLRF